MQLLILVWLIALGVSQKLFNWYLIFIFLHTTALLFQRWALIPTAVRLTHSQLVNEGGAGCLPQRADGMSVLVRRATKGRQAQTKGCSSRAEHLFLWLTSVALKTEWWSLHYNKRQPFQEEWKCRARRGKRENPSFFISYFSCSQYSVMKSWPQEEATTSKRIEKSKTSHRGRRNNLPFLWLNAIAP